MSRNNTDEPLFRTARTYANEHEERGFIHWS